MVGDIIGEVVGETANVAFVCGANAAAKIPDKINKLIPKIKTVLFNIKNLLFY